MREEQDKKDKLKKQKKIALIVIGVFLLLLTLQVFFITHKNAGKILQKPTKNTPSTESRVIFEQPKLNIFGELSYINQFPDRLHVHYPYLLVVTPGDINHTTTIYSFKTNTKIAQFDKIGLDYFDGNFLYSQKKYSFFNKVNLGLQCDQGFIKSKTEIYCITAKQDDPLDNKLISINPQNLVKHEIYSSSNLLETASSINGELYISELNINTHQAYLTVGKTTVEIPTQGDIIYPMGKKVYYATFKVNERKQDAEYYEINTSNNGVTIKLIEKGRVIF
jgi:hypothetical protein